MLPGNQKLNEVLLINWCDRISAFVRDHGTAKHYPTGILLTLIPCVPRYGAVISIHLSRESLASYLIYANVRNFNDSQYV